MFVIITQSKERLREVTARRYRLQNSSHFFAFESTDPRYCMGLGLPNTEGNESFQIGGVVAAVYRPFA